MDADIRFTYCVITKNSKIFLKILFFGVLSLGQVKPKFLFEINIQRTTDLGEKIIILFHI